MSTSMAESPSSEKPLEISSIPTPPSESLVPESCPFCLEPLDPSALVLNCGHTFHGRCAVQFLLRKRQCPSCRAPVTADGILDASQVPEAAQGKHYCPKFSRADGTPDGTPAPIKEQEAKKERAGVTVHSRNSHSQGTDGGAGYSRPRAARQGSIPGVRRPSRSVQLANATPHAPAVIFATAPPPVNHVITLPVHGGDDNRGSNYVLRALTLIGVLLCIAFLIAIFLR